MLTKRPDPGREPLNSEHPHFTVFAPKLGFNNISENIFKPN